MIADCEKCEELLQPYLDRELSWLAFNTRVLELAESDRLPLLERARFLATEVVAREAEHVEPAPLQLAVQLLAPVDHGEEAQHLGRTLDLVGQVVDDLVERAQRQGRRDERHQQQGAGDRGDVDRVRAVAAGLTMVGGAPSGPPPSRKFCTGPVGGRLGVNGAPSEAAPEAAPEARPDAVPEAP